MINQITKARSFFVSYLIIFFISISFFFYREHGDFVLLVNEFHNSFFDFFFKYWTYTGSWIFFTVLGLASIFLRKRFGIVLSAIGVTVALFSLFFKMVLFPNAPRPKLFFESQMILKSVEGVEMLDLYSFPSGHSMAAFAIATFFALNFQNRRLSILFLFLAILTGLSRIYLAQHFLLDVMAGSLIGVIIPTTFYFIFEKYLKGTNATELRTPDEDLQTLNLEEDLD